MRRSLAACFAGLILCACQSTPSGGPAPRAEAKAPASPVFEPARGVSCNRQTKVCENRGGASAGLTRLFFDDAAGDAVAARMAAGGYRYDRIFSPATGVNCDTLVTTCYDAGGASAELTRKYFGSGAEKRLGRRVRSIQRYGKFVTCDRTSEVCYDRLGAGYGVTRMYIGDAAADQLLKRMRPWLPQKPPPAPAAPPTPPTPDAV
jgi:hypothetical protein